MIQPLSPLPVSARPLRSDLPCVPWRVLGAALIGLILLFSVPLLQWLTLAGESSLYSHVFLIPAVSLYFVWIKRADLPAASPPGRTGSIAALSISLVTAVGFWWMSRGDGALPLEDRVFGYILAFVIGVIGVCAWFAGRRTLLAWAFPLGFLVFMVPFPTVVRDAIESFFQHTSAAMAAVFFSVAGTPFFRDQTFFQLPGINLEVAPECSGIRSSLALFITSLVAGQLFLRSPWKRLVLALVVIPLGIVRNGLRIFVIGELCVRISPDMIDSYIHRQGGPVFFALSLIPFSALLYLLVRSDRPPARPISRSSVSVSASTDPTTAR